MSRLADEFEDWVGWHPLAAFVLLVVVVFGGGAAAFWAVVWLRGVR